MVLVIGQIKLQLHRVLELFTFLVIYIFLIPLKEVFVQTGGAAAAELVAVAYYQISQFKT